MGKGWKANHGPKKQVTGFTLVECLNNFIKPPQRHPELPVRLPISNIYNIKGVGQIICGTVEQGTLSPGDEVGIVPSGLKGKKISPSSNTRRYCHLQVLVTQLVYPSRVSVRMRRYHLVILSTLRKRENLSQSSPSLLSLLYKSTLVFSSL